MVKRSRDGTEISVAKETSEASEDARVATINSVHDDELRKIFEILGKGYFLPVAGTCKRFYRIFKQCHPECQTSAENLVQSVSGAAFLLRENGQESRFVLWLEVPGIWGEGDTNTVEHAFTPDRFVCESAVLHGRLEVLKYMRQFVNYQFELEFTCASAAMNGHLSVLQWLREQGNPWSRRTCYWAAARGQLEVLKWATANGCPGKSNICSYAARFGQLEVLEWARTNGFPWNTTIYSIRRNGDNDVVKWALANGCPRF